MVYGDTNSTLAGADTDSIIKAHKKAKKVRVSLKNGLYGDGHAADIIVKNLLERA